MQKCKNMVKLAKVTRIDGVIYNGDSMQKSKNMVKLAKITRIDGVINNEI